ncbi:hypothetical protein E1B28_003256 [Marasmius oreades]|uniref:DUF4100 domain-containing protein n=1 Tax=Marasmius oreades TaxID=181124 RepID=A0A9P7UJK0_9AGAR|nr:uncharacterized protein E1B28_003256 [Marasmius oreades]KAG7085712.1 hypothetical protein E1B28_003256 [Marasmius oreades]
MVPDAGAFGTQQQEEDSGEDSESESESESDEEDYEKWRKKFKERRKKKSRTKSKDIKNSYPTPTVPMAPAEVSRTTQFSGPQSEVADLITRLNSMQLDHPEYGTLYYRATTMDPHSKACINKIPSQQFIPNSRPPNSYSGGQGNRPPNNFSRDGRGIGVNSYEQRPPPNSSFACFGCGNPKHRITECPLVTERITKQEIKWCPDRRRYVLFDGSDLGRPTPGEALIQAIERNIRPKDSQINQSLNQAMLLTISDAVQNFYAQQGTNQPNNGEEIEYETASEVSGERSESESDGYSGMWGESESEVSEISEIEESSHTYDTNLTQTAVHLGAERTKTTSRTSRNQVQQGPGDNSREFRAKRAVQPPKRADGTIPTWQETVGAHKRSPRAGTTKGKKLERISGKISEVNERIGNELPNTPLDRNKMDTRPDNSAAAEHVPPAAPILAVTESPRGHSSSALPLHPALFDARPSSFRRAISLEPELLAQGNGRTESLHRTTRQHVKINEPEVTKVAPPPTQTKRERKTDLARHVDIQDVISQILGTTIQMPLGEILGASKELSTVFHELTKVKVPKATKSSKTVLAQTNVPHTNAYFTHNAQLIEILLEFEGNYIRAIIDTGSMINVISSKTYEAAIRLPIDLGRQTVMHDANGGEGVLRGAIDGLKLLCGSVETVGFFYVGESVPFEMLLGRPWLRENAVSIDERRNGTYLVFKDKETWDPRFEMLASTILGQRPQFRLATRAKGAAIRSFLARFVTSRKPERGDDRSSSGIEEIPETDIEETAGEVGATTPTLVTQEIVDEEDNPQRQPYYDGFDIPHTQFRLRPVRWDQTDMERDLDSQHRSDRDGDLTIPEVLLQNPTSDSPETSLLRSLVHSVSPEPDNLEDSIPSFSLLLPIWMDILITVSLIVLLWMKTKLEGVVGPEEGIRGSSSTPPDSPHHNTSFYFSMPPLTRQQARRSTTEAGPPAPASTVAQPQPIHSTSYKPPSPTFSPPPHGLVDPGPIDPVGASPHSKTTGMLIRDLCDQAANQYRNTGRIHTRPSVLSTAQAYLVAAEPTENGGIRQELLVLNAGLMLHNPTEKKNSFQLGHAYIRFYPLSNPLPIAPKAVLAQHLVYTYHERKPVTLKVAQAELASGVHSLRPADFHTTGPFPISSSPAIQRSQGELDLVYPSGERYSPQTFSAVQTLNPAVCSDEDEDMPDLVECGSDMDVDQPGSAATSPSSYLPSPASSTGATCGSDRSTESQTQNPKPSATISPHDLAPFQYSVPTMPNDRVPFFDSKLTPNTRLLPSIFMTIGQLDRTIKRPPAGQPVFDLTKSAREVEPGELTSIYQIDDGAILHEHPKESLNRLVHAWKGLFDELHFQVIEERSEEYYREDVPNMDNRKEVARHFEDPKVCRQLTNRLRYRMFLSHTLLTQPLMEQDGFDREEWTNENEFRGVRVALIGRWKYRRIVALAIIRRLYRVMVFTVEFFLLRKVEHLFRARYAAYIAQGNGLERYPPLLDNRFFREDQRRWLIVAWEIFVYLQEIELSALAQAILRLQFKDSEALENLHLFNVLPRLPTNLPGVDPVYWTDILARKEDIETFISHVTLPSHPASFSHSSPPASTVNPASLSSLLNPTKDSKPASTSSPAVAVL